MQCTGENGNLLVIKGPEEAVIQSAVGVDGSAEALVKALENR